MNWLLFRKSILSTNLLRIKSNIVLKTLHKLNFSKSLNCFEISVSRKKNE